MVSTRPLISKSSSLFNNSSVTVERTPITIVINVIFMFRSFFNSQARSWYLSFISISLNFTLWSAGTAKSTILQVLFFHDHYYLLEIINVHCWNFLSFLLRCGRSPYEWGIQWDYKIILSLLLLLLWLLLLVSLNYKYSLIITFTLSEFFTSTLADGVLLEFEWQQVSSSFQDSSQYSGRSQ